MKLRLLENGLVPISETNTGERVVDARELHDRLASNRRFTDWIKYRIEQYGLIEGEDFITILGESTGGRPSTEYILTFDVAKELAIVENNEAGRKIRRYFIEVEKRYQNSVDAFVPKTLPEALRAYAVALEEKMALEHKVEQDKPRVLFSQAVEASDTSILIGDLAKILKQNGVDVGQNRLFEWMRDNGYLIKSGASRNMPTQYSMERGWFEVQQRVIQVPSGEPKVKTTTRVTGKGQLYFVNRFMSDWEKVAQ